MSPRPRTSAERNDLWSAVHSSARLVDPSPGRYVIVAPHPDDEVLTVGGLCIRLVRAGAEVVVIAVTDGGSAYPQHFAHDDLALERRREQNAAVSELGLSSRNLVTLGLVDGEVTPNEHLLAEWLQPICTPTTTIVAPWEHDHHSDHEAVGRVALRIASDNRCTLWSSLFWAWHHAGHRLSHSPDIIRVDLDADVQRIKERALQAHASQLRPDGVDPMLTDALLEPARWSSEYFIRRTPEGQR